MSIKDVQSFVDNRNIPINQVGIKSIRHPIQIDGQICIANVDMMVNLPAEVKGTHMSRFVEILGCEALELSIGGLSSLLDTISTRLLSQNAFVNFQFPYFVKKTAPVSGVQSLLDYEVNLIAELSDDACKRFIKVVVPITSLCPCSKEISEYGAHNQRSHVTATIEYNEQHRSNDITILQIIELIEKQASCELYGLLKRPDEKYVTERAYDNPKFVEDLVRDIAAQFKMDKRISSFTISSENFESIHNHSAFAQISFINNN